MVHLGVTDSNPQCNKQFEVIVVSKLQNTDAAPPCETRELGSPLDYTSDVYRVYFEVRDSKDIAKETIAEFVGHQRAEEIITLAHGYEVALPIQCVPDIIRLLCAKNIAIYQVVRYAKTNESW